MNITNTCIGTLGLLFALNTFSVELINCTGFANVKTRCVVDQNIELGHEIVSSLGNRDITEFTEFSVDYKLDCRNAPVYITLNSGSGNAQLINDGLSHNTVVIGKSVLKALDSNPSDTYRRYYDEVCSLNIEDVRILPSQDSIDQWGYDAIDQADDIEKSLSLYELAKEYINYRGWSVSKTELLLTETNRKVTYFTARCDRGDTSSCSAKIHFQAVANSLQSRLDSDPSTLPPVGEESIALLSFYKAELLEEVTLGRDMVTRFETWAIAVQEDLDEILLQVPANFGEI